MSENQKKRGRPRIEVDLEEIAELAAEGNGCEEIARVLGFSKSTLFGRTDIREAYEKGRAQMAVNLRHWQMELAKSGNPQMLMWLGKQYLGQQDKQAVESTTTTIDPATRERVKAMLKDADTRSSGSGD